MNFVLSQSKAKMSWSTIAFGTARVVRVSDFVQILVLKVHALL